MDQGTGKLDTSYVELLSWTKEQVNDALVM